jgi:hypothetical protein
MADSWEDWDNDDYEAPILQTQEQLKRLEEQKLVEEADNALARDLFQDDEDLATKEVTNHTANKAVLVQKNKPEKNSKQKENEEKQKAASKKLKEEKAKREKEKELFGDAYYDDTYADYEDQFY